MKIIKITGVTLFFLMTGAVTSFAQGWQALDGSWSYEKEDGTIASQEWIQDNETWYYLDETGTMQTGWLQDAGDWYYLKADGSMAHLEWIEENGVRYYLEASGVWNSDAQQAAGKQTGDAAEEERYQQWLQSIQDGEPEEIFN